MSGARVPVLAVLIAQPVSNTYPGRHWVITTQINTWDPAAHIGDLDFISFYSGIIFHCMDITQLCIYSCAYELLIVSSV